MSTLLTAMRETRPDGLVIRSFRAADFFAVEPWPVFEPVRRLLGDIHLYALETAPSFTAEVPDGIVGCGGWGPKDGGVEVWALVDRRLAPRHALKIVRVAQAWLDRLNGPVRALIDPAFAPSRRFAELLGFADTGETDRSPDDRPLAVYLRKAPA